MLFYVFFFFNSIFSEATAKSYEILEIKTT